MSKKKIIQKTKKKSKPNTKHQKKQKTTTKKKKNTTKKNTQNKMKHDKKTGPLAHKVLSLKQHAPVRCVVYISVFIAQFNQ